ncbi:complement C1q tumor necrosis factor-related protein 3-like [Mytilus trossulus]|uniref:complement C1q tumor necrosis factor-related protein 3-like n=1 Tax=Mytilus trossulus TaxID=6551 RepID=UPI0030070DE9
MFCTIVALAMFFICENHIMAEARCEAAKGKTTCITEDLLEMLMNIKDQRSQVSTMRPVFFAFLKSSTTYSGSMVYKFDDVRTNIGNGYNPDAGVFTAPKKGIYQINCVISALPNIEVYYQVMRNDAVFGHGTTSKGLYDSSTNVWIVELAKGDRVYIQHRNGARKFHTNLHSYFGGYLL